MTPTTLDTQLAALREWARVPFESAEMIPSFVYTSEPFYVQELATVFGKQWFCAGRTDEMPTPGDYFCFAVGATPAIVLRDDSGSVRALSPGHRCDQT